MTAAIVLAAGESRRMGFPKLTLEHEGKTLLRHAVDKAKALSEKVLVVVGAYPDVYGPEARAAGATVVQNPEWEEGLASSLRVGVAALPEATHVALILLADQPFVGLEHLQILLDTQQRSGASLVFSRYEGVSGAPAVLHKSTFAAADLLRGNTGFKALGDQFETRTVDLTDAFDIDTPEDAARLDGSS